MVDIFQNVCYILSTMNHGSAAPHNTTINHPNVPMAEMQPQGPVGDSRSWLGRLAGRVLESIHNQRPIAQLVHDAHTFEHRVDSDYEAQALSLLDQGENGFIARAADITSKGVERLGSNQEAIDRLLAKTWAKLLTRVPESSRQRFREQLQPNNLHALSSYLTTLPADQSRFTTLRGGAAGAGLGDIHDTLIANYLQLRPEEAQTMRRTHAGVIDAMDFALRVDRQTSTMTPEDAKRLVEGSQRTAAKDKIQREQISLTLSRAGLEPADGQLTVDLVYLATPSAIFNPNANPASLAAAHRFVSDRIYDRHPGNGTEEGDTNLRGDQQESIRRRASREQRAEQVTTRDPSVFDEAAADLRRMEEQEARLNEQIRAQQDKQSQRLHEAEKALEALAREERLIGVGPRSTELGRRRAQLMLEARYDRLAEHEAALRRFGAELEAEQRGRRGYVGAQVEAARQEIAQLEAQRAVIERAFEPENLLSLIHQAVAAHARNPQIATEEALGTYLDDYFHRNGIDPNSLPNRVRRNAVARLNAAIAPAKQNAIK